MSDEIIEKHSPKEKLTVSPRELVIKYLQFLPWLILSVGVMLTLAYIKLRYTTPIFSVNSKLLVKRNSNPYSAANEKFDDIFMLQSSNSNLNDEIEFLRSRFMAARVVKALGIQLQFFNKGNIRTSAIHKADMPFDFKIANLRDSTIGFGVRITIVNDQTFRINEDTTVRYFGSLIDYRVAQFSITKKSLSLKDFSSNEFIVSYSPLEQFAASLSAGIKVNQLGDYSNVVTLSYDHENTKIGLDIVNQFMIEYQKATLEDKKQIAVNTLSFIDEQLASVNQDLSAVEKNLQGSREKNKIFSPELQSQMLFNEYSEANKSLSESQVKVRVVELLERYLSDRSNPYRNVPSTMGIEEPILLQQLSEYNKLIVGRETELKSTTALNPIIKTYETTIEKLRLDLLENLSNIKKAYQISISDIQQKSQQANLLISSIPAKDRQMLEVRRQQSILEELYSYLLQKKLETSISSASTISNIKILEHAMASNSPVSPKKGGIYTVFLFVGLLIPVAVIFLREYLNDKVNTKADVEKITETPIYGEIGHATEGESLVVTKNNRKFIAEQFRIIRSNLKYSLSQVEVPVLMVTSSYSGEGKSFVSTNIGAVMAISGKRTVILEFDIRKPKIMAGLGLHERKGITNFIVGDFGINEVVIPVPGQENLFVIPCGPVPPNPSEMLLDKKVGEIFAELKKSFDIIIVDTAPVGLVSDAITLGSHATTCMYIVRHQYTFKKQIELIDELYKLKKLPNLGIIVNDIQVKSGYGGYYGYGNYGYGYGHGYGYGNATASGYFDVPTEDKRSGSLWRRIKRLF